MVERNKRKVREGWVVSNRMDKTIVVSVERRFRHPWYEKIIRRTSKLYAHDDKNECQIGDKVRVMETRPLSKLKRWRLLGIVEKAK
ncbi:MAG: 30S ribosomal protein S17 [candidate division Zixibacteria bacterium SM23_73_3]|nr:MAG: 30S ribosomal protein S17 [candidate division Zixibacteria bacterium SM23_73_3]